MGFRSEIRRMRDKQAALAHVERVGKGVRALIDTSDPSRVERAEGIMDRVNPIRDSLSEVAAAVSGSGRGSVGSGIVGGEEERRAGRSGTTPTEEEWMTLLDAEAS